MQVQVQVDVNVEVGVQQQVDRCIDAGVATVTGAGARAALLGKGDSQPEDGVFWWGAGVVAAAPATLQTMLPQLGET